MINFFYKVFCKKISELQGHLSSFNCLILLFMYYILIIFFCLLFLLLFVGFLTFLILDSFVFQDTQIFLGHLSGCRFCFSLWLVQGSSKEGSIFSGTHGYLFQHSLCQGWICIFSSKRFKFLRGLLSAWYFHCLIQFFYQDIAHLFTFRKVTKVNHNFNLHLVKLF